MILKRLTIFLFVGLLSPALSGAAESHKMPLKEVPLDLRSLESNQLHKYRWVSVIQKGTNIQSKDYALLVASSGVVNKKLEFHDTITLGASYKGTIFDRKLVFPEGNLFAPERVSIDVTGGGRTLRQLNYQNGKATFVEFSGATKTEKWRFDDGILTFNTLLRIAPLLPREIGNVYTFQAYAEPILFRTHKAEKKDEPFTLTCEGSENVKVGEKSYDCVRFRLELKLVQVRTDIWVGKNNLVVKFVDTLPEGADANFLEATLQE